MSSQLRPDPLGGSWMHLCVDMQRMFREQTEWAFPWPDYLLAHVVSICSVVPERTIFTRFVPVQRPGEGLGNWKRVYQRWPSMTLERTGRDMIELVPELNRFQAPAFVVDRQTYSAWNNPALNSVLQNRGARTIAISGVETDMCVLAAILGAVDRGYRTILITDAVHSSAAPSQAAVLDLLHSRFTEQLELADTMTFLDRLSSER